MRAFIVRVIWLSGFEVGVCMQASNGKEALELLQTNWIDIVLTDINMPVMNGEELVCSLEKDEMLRTIPVLVVSTAVTGPRGGARELTLKRDLGSTVVRLSGAVAAGSPPQALTIALEDPARYAATVFAEALAAKGILLAGGVDTTSEPLPAGTRVLAAHDSPPMSEMVSVVNKVSQNLHTEMLLRLLGAQAKGEGSVEMGHAAVDDFLRRLGVPADSWAVQDASGLSRSDLVTAHGMAALLAAMERHRYAAAFRDSLPVAGVDGTLATRMEQPALRGKVVAKTGTIRHVNALAGYVTARSGQRFVFYAAVNHHPGPSSDSVAALDAIAALLAAQ